MYFRIVSTFLVMVALTTGCSDSNDKVLEEVKALRKEVAQLREAVSEVHRLALDSRKTNTNRRVARATERKKLERLCCYISRPAVSEKRLSLTPNGFSSILKDFLNMVFSMVLSFSRKISH